MEKWFEEYNKEMQKQLDVISDINRNLKWERDPVTILLLKTRKQIAEDKITTLKKFYELYLKNKGL